MKVEIVEFELGARQAAQRRAITVVVDALRASATAITALAVGADAVLPVLTVEVARRFVGRKGFRVAGERNAITCEGFDFGNSPTELRHHRSDLLGQTLVLTTSNGTRMVGAASAGATAVLLGTTLNGRAVAQAAHALSLRTGLPILIVAAGEFDVRAEEDLCAARYIAHHLHRLGAEVDEGWRWSEEPTAIFRATPSATQLCEWGFDRDIDYCAQRDLYDIAPVLIGDRFIPYQAAHLDRIA